MRVLPVSLVLRFFSRLSYLVGYKVGEQHLLWYDFNIQMPIKRNLHFGSKIA